jgi:hypothetical protein
VAVFTDLEVPHTRVSHDGTSYVFHGSFDYVMGLIESRDVGMQSILYFILFFRTVCADLASTTTASLARGSLKLNISKMLSGVLEAKSLAEMQNEVPQIIVQVLTVLGLTSVPLPYFCIVNYVAHSMLQAGGGVLTNGALWRFFTAYDGEDQIRIYTSPEFATDSDAGLIIELLKDMVT